MTPTQVLEIISPSEAVIAAPPEAVWEAMRLNYRYFPREPVEEFEAEQWAFYTKYVDAGGIAILSHAEVADRYLLKARQVVLTMTLRYPARDRLMFQHEFYMILFEPTTGPENIKNIPELYNEREGYYYEKNTCRMTFSLLGGGGVNGYCTAGVSHEHLGAMRTFTPEFAHALDSEMERLKPGFRDRVGLAYQKAKASDAYRNLWDPYIMADSREYWAEGTEIWYYGIGEGREFETHEAFAEVDPLLYALLSEWFYLVLCQSLIDGLNFTRNPTSDCRSELC